MLYIAQTPSHSQLQRIQLGSLFPNIGKGHLQNVNGTEVLYAMFRFLLSTFFILKKSPETELHEDIFRNLPPVAPYFNTVKREAFHIPRPLLPVSISEALAVALHVTWAVCHSNLNKDKQQLPVLLHFHFSRERIALAGAKNAKALAWNRGNLVKRERRDGDILWGHCSWVGTQTTLYWL